MNNKKMTVGFAVLLAVLSCGSLSLAAGGWTSLHQLPKKEAGIQLEQPVSLAIDAQAKRYYVVDAGSGQLVSFDQDGKFLAAFNAGGQLIHPVAMVKSSTGSLWVVDRSSNELYYINPRQKELQRFSPVYPDGTAVFMSRLAVDDNDRLYVLDRFKGQVLRLDDNLKIEQSYSGDKDNLTFTDFRIRAGKLWALDTLSRSIASFDLSGQRDKIIKVEGLQFPTAFEVDSIGQFYLLDRHAGTVVVYGQAGRKKFAFLGKGKRAGQLWNGSDLLFDWDNRLCVVDEGSGRVEILTR